MEYDAIIEVEFDIAILLYNNNHDVYCLYDDGSEGLCEEDHIFSKDSRYGIEGKLFWYDGERK